MKPITVKRKIYKSPIMSIESFMTFEKVKRSDYNGKVTLHGSSTPMVAISPTFNSKEFDRQKNIYFYEAVQEDINSFFQSTLDWFYNPKLQDLYYLNEENGLEFNYDYKDLKNTLSFGTQTRQLMYAIPTKIESSGGASEGIYLVLNKEQYHCNITLKELKRINNVLQKFSFQTETLLLYQLFDSAVNHGTEDLSSNGYNVTKADGGQNTSTVENRPKVNPFKL